MSEQACFVRSVSGLMRQASDPTRLKALMFLDDGETNVGDLAEALGLNRQVLSYHLVLMRVGGLVASRRCGQRIFYSLAGPGRRLVEAARLIGGG